jgi:hypothetical protein
MKKLLAIVAIAGLTACGEERSDINKSEELSDTTSMSSQARDMNTTNTQGLSQDTTDLGSGVRGDSTSASGIHGKGSGSRVGGGVTGGAQGESSDATKKQ